MHIMSCYNWQQNGNNSPEARAKSGSCLCNLIFVGIYVCMHTYMYVCMHACVYVRMNADHVVLCYAMLRYAILCYVTVQMYVFTYVCMHTCMHVFVYGCVDMYVYMYVYKDLSLSLSVFIDIPHKVLASKRFLRVLVSNWP